MSAALIPQLVEKSQSQSATRLLVWGVGVLLMAVLAQVHFTMPWTLVPITGQTFGVAFIALLAGRRLAFSIVATYLAIGWLGLPVFALGARGFAFGPTFGYLIGMLLASALVGQLADRGWGRNFWSALLAAYMGSFVTFICGLAVLSHFVPSEQLLHAGLYPFMLGDLVKNVLAVALTQSLYAGVRRS